jgi:hypothetical protein
MIAVMSVVAVLLATGGATADLVNNGNGLIYDTDLNITYYDYSSTANTWADAVNWAASLTVNGVGDWRLPSSKAGAYAWGYDGTTTGGFNITSSEMGHLFYAELGNSGEYDTSGNETPVAFEDSDIGNAIHNRGPFANLQFGDLWVTQDASYWSSTGPSGLNAIWAFNTTYGYQDAEDKVHPSIESGYVMAVHDGNVVPEPPTLVLLASGLIGLLACAWRRRTA